MTDGKSFDLVFEEVDSVEPLGGPDSLVDDLPLSLDENGSDFRRWTPPPLPFELQLEHLIGGDVLSVVPSNPEDAGTRELNRAVRRLPGQLRSLLQSVSDDSHRVSLLDCINVEVRKAAAPIAVRFVTIPGSIHKTSYLPEVHRRAALNKLAQDPTFVARIKSRIDEIKRRGHLANTYGGYPGVLPELSVCTVPAGSSWDAESWLGLSTSSLPEAMPEEVAVAIAQRTWRRLGHLTGRARRHPVGRVLHWGALNSTLGFALECVAPLRRTLVIHEIDTVGQLPSRAWRAQRFARLPEHGEYDLVVVHVPPPAEGANQFRNLYKDLVAPTQGEIRLDDLGRRGPRKWRRGLRKLINTVVHRLKPDGELVLLLPTAVRVAPLVDGYPQWGYEARAGLLDGVKELLLANHLAVTADLAVVEKNPLNQPFFVDRRCPWRLLIAAPNSAAERDDNDSVDALLATLEDDLG